LQKRIINPIKNKLLKFINIEIAFHTFVSKLNKRNSHKCF
jgi:hypothetical protein